MVIHQRTHIKIILIILFLTQLSNTYKTSCGKGCAKCTEGTFKKCLACSKRKILEDGSCSQTKEPGNDLCLLYNKDGCDFCKKGYVPYEGECKPPKIKDCAVLFIKEGREICPLCWEGYPNESLTECIRASGRSNCRIGGRPVVDSEICGYCEEKEYMSVNDKCEKKVNFKIQGCYIGYRVYGLDKCQWCDFYEGWYDPDGSGDRCLKE